MEQNWLENMQMGIKLLVSDKLHFKCFDHFSRLDYADFDCQVLPYFPIHLLDINIFDL